MQNSRQLNSGWQTYFFLIENYNGEMKWIDHKYRSGGSWSPSPGLDLLVYIVWHQQCHYPKHKGNGGPPLGIEFIVWL